MSENSEPPGSSSTPPNRLLPWLTLDWFAVIVALILVVLVLVGVLGTVTW